MELEAPQTGATARYGGTKPPARFAAHLCARGGCEQATAQHLRRHGAEAGRSRRVPERPHESPRASPNACVCTSSSTLYCATVNAGRETDKIGVFALGPLDQRSVQLLFKQVRRTRNSLVASLPACWRHRVVPCRHSSGTAAFCVATREQSWPAPLLNAGSPGLLSRRAPRLRLRAAL